VYICDTLVLAMSILDVSFGSGRVVATSVIYLQSPFPLTIFFKGENFSVSCSFPPAKISSPAIATSYCVVVDCC